MITDKQKKHQKSINTLIKEGVTLSDEDNNNTINKKFKNVTDNIADYCYSQALFHLGIGIDSLYVSWLQQAVKNEHEEAKLILEDRGLPLESNAKEDTVMTDEKIKTKRIEADQAYKAKLYKLAHSIVEPLAELGDLNSLHNLAVLYYEGRANFKNFEELNNQMGIAFKWFTLAAKQGFKASQYNLAYMNYFGKGTYIDVDSAKSWYRKAYGFPTDFFNYRYAGWYSKA